MTAPGVDTRKLLLRLAIFAAPFAIVAGLELFVLPLPFFAFRVWEAAIVKDDRSRLPGFFYPNLRLRKTEEGDLGHGTELAVKKDVVWVTDAFGYRNDAARFDDIDIVVVGDSQLVGSSLTQGDIFTAELEKLTGRHVYAMATAGVASFLLDPRFELHPPRIVVFEQSERTLFRLQPIGKLPRIENPGEALADPVFDPFWQRLWVFHDRAMNLTVLEMLRARLLPVDRGVVRSPRGSMLFSCDFREEEPDGNLDATADLLVGYQRALRERGIPFGVMPVPDKETVYFQNLPTPRRRASLARLTERLRTRGVPVIDLDRAFADHVATNGPDRELIYQLDDTHWSPAGVRLAAELAARAIPPPPRP